MNIGSIGTSAYSFYNSASRINNANAEAAARVQEAKDPRESKVSEQQEQKSAAIYQREDYTGPAQTQVAPESSYQKQMLSDPHFAMERMAGKLMDKLPQIFADMSKLVSPASTGSADVQETAAKKIITENDPASYLERQAQNAYVQEAALQDIKL